MLKAELLELIANGESSGVEFKRDDLRPEQVAKEIVALANLSGGRLLLGVEDDGSISGLTRGGTTEQWVMDVVFGRYVHPMVLPFYEEVLVDQGLRVGVITIPMGVTKPYVVRHNDREDIYVRVGKHSRLATREQQARLFASGAMVHPEAFAVSGATLDDLSMERLTDYVVAYLRDASAPTTAEAWEQRLTGLGFMTPSSTGRAMCSIAGLALFGRTPRRALRQAGARWLAFAGVDRGAQALDDAVLDGPLVALTRRSSSGAVEVLEPGLLERLVERMSPFVSSEDTSVGASLRRERRWRYPVEALREGLLNAMVHRDWTRSAEVEVASFDDRLEITSPGALQNSMTIEKMLAGQRSPRNPLLVDVMRDYGYVDARGMGVRRKIVPLVREASGSEARFEAADDFVRVILPASRGVNSVLGTASS